MDSRDDEKTIEQILEKIKKLMEFKLDERRRILDSLIAVPKLKKNLNNHSDE